MKDNRDYQYKSSVVSYRSEYRVILNWIEPGSSVIDLGCGDGSLLKLLSTKGVRGEGIEISQSGVRVALSRGLKVKQGSIDQKLKYPNNKFDYAICNVTLPMVMYPEILLSEMIRISKKQIISFPNFAFINNRFELFFKGRMPQGAMFGHKWYSSGLIHQLSLADFEIYCQQHGIEILNKYMFTTDRFGPIPRKILMLFPNLFTVTGVYLLRK